MKLRRILIFLLLSFILTFPSTPFPQTKDPGKVYKVAILPFVIHSEENLDYLREGIYDMLASRITVEGKIDVIDRSLVEHALYEERPIRLDEAAATKIGRRVDADYIVLGSLTKVGGYISLDARLISITEEKPPIGVYTQHKGTDDLMVKIGDFAQDMGYKILGRRITAGRPGEVRPSSVMTPRRGIEKIGSEELGYKKSQNFNFEIRGLDVGDVDGDKKNEVVVMDDHNLYIFKYDGDRLTFFQKIEHGNEHNFLTLDVADVNRNGIAEIIVTSVVEDDLRSFIIEYEEGKFKKITEKAGWSFRVLKHPKEDPILIGQQMGSEGLLVDPVYQFIWKKKSFEKGQKMAFPRGTTVFGMAMADLRGEGKSDIILYDQNRLNILSQDGKVLWESASRYGGTNIFYETKKKKRDAYRPLESPPWRVYIPPRILVRDLDGDGLPEVIVSKNDFLTGTFFQDVRSYEKGDIYDLIWDNDTLTTNWKTTEIKGYVADYQVKDADDDGNEELVVAVVPPERGSKSHILFYKLF
jgi:TolB-like protein